MNILDDAKRNFQQELRTQARARIIRKLEKADLNYRALDPAEFERLVDAEVKLLESDAKKVGFGIGVGFSLSMLLGF
jgi:ribose 1,5-bisphosphokinase PhnN